MMKIRIDKDLRDIVSLEESKKILSKNIAREKELNLIIGRGLVRRIFFLGLALGLVVYLLVGLEKIYFMILGLMMISLILITSLKVKRNADRIDRIHKDILGEINKRLRRLRAQEEEKNISD